MMGVAEHSEYRLLTRYLLGFEGVGWREWCIREY
jgi:hypothetical protein